MEFIVIAGVDAHNQFGRAQTVGESDYKFGAADTTR
jgi:hypothetical protein